MNDTARARKYFRLTIYGPKDNSGERWWNHKYPVLAQVLAGAKLLGVDPEKPDRITWMALIMNELNPDSRKVVTEKGRTPRYQSDGFTGEPTKHQKEKIREESSPEWRNTFPAIPECRFCDSPMELILRQLRDEENPEWRIEDRRLRDIRPNHPPKWFELWAWHCSSCDRGLVEESMSLLRHRNRRLYG